MPAASIKITEELPPLPFERQYEHGGLYYVRKCYQDYYRYVKAMLESGKQCVTVTGTPGIGKSVFYAYFFKHFLEETNDTWVIAISSVGRTIEEAAVFDDHGTKIKTLLHFSTMFADIDAAAVEAIEAKKKLLFLCDGAPERRWRAGKMVVFTSPNVKWLKMVADDDCTLYMPLWTLEELQEAAFALGLTGSESREGEGDITEGEIEARFSLFGGVARECFLPAQRLLKMQEDLEAEIDDVSNLKDLDRLMYGVASWSEYHRVLHSVPCFGNYGAKSHLASPFVVERLGRRLLQSVEGDRQKLMNALDNIDRTEPLREWVFRTGVHDVLQQGCVVTAQLLHDGDSASYNKVREIFRIAKGSQLNVSNIEKLSPTSTTCGPYHAMEAPTQAVDGFYLPALKCHRAVTAQDVVEWNATNRLILFRVGLSETLSVDASEISLVLEKLGLLEAVETDPKRVALVVVAPEAVARNYSRQQVDPEATDDTSVAAFMGVGPVAADVLMESGISTVGQLKTAISANNLPEKLIRGGVVASLLSMRAKSYSEAIAKIPQYVWPLSKADISLHFKKTEA